MPADRLREVRDQVAGGHYSLTPETQRAIVERVDGLVGAITAADRALAKVPDPAVAEAAAKTAHVFYISGHGWRRFLAETAEAARAGTEIESALRESISLMLPQLEHAFAGRTTAILKRSPQIWCLTCAVCGGEAVTFSRTRIGPDAPEQLVVSSVSPVTVFRPVSGPRMLDLIKLLEAGDAASLLKHMKETQAAGCDAYCQQCDRVYCKEHTAIEAQWTGSWHDATWATCALGHEREIE